MKDNTKQVFGTYEWAVENANFISGCRNNCKYCYSREMAIRFKRKTTENWSTEEINYNQFNKRVKKVDGFIMFPSSHDITPDNLPSTFVFLGKLLKVKNNILIVSKPYFEDIEAICCNFSEYKKIYYFVLR